MNATALALIFSLAAIGISETVYLIRKRRASEKPFCPIGGGCEVVLSSKYNKLFIIHNDVAGLLFYVVVSIVSGILVIGSRYDQDLLLVFNLLIVSGSLMSLLFTFLQWKVIKAWCFWCLMSATTIWGMAIILTTSMFI